MGIFRRKPTELDDEQIAALRQATELQRRGELTDDEFGRLSRKVLKTPRYGVSGS